MNHWVIIGFVSSCISHSNCHLPAISEANILSTFEQLHRQEFGDALPLECSGTVYEDEFFSIRYFQKGIAHLTFKRLDLIERMNDIIAKYFPGMLASPH
jgi:hypothetical protein